MTSTVSSAVGEGELREFSAPNKKAKRPCDGCRRRKVRCDGEEIAGSRCTSCTTWHLKCTYLEAPKKRTNTSDAYVKNLELRLEQVQKLLLKVGHGTDFSDEFSGTARTDELRKIGQSHPHSTPASLGGDIPDGDDELQSSDDEFVTFNPTDDCGAALSFGKSSEAVLIKTIVEMKKELLKPDGSEPGPVGEEHRLDGYLPTRRRQKFWRPELWAHLTLDAPEPKYHFPDPDLLPSLVDKYFTHMNLIFPLLHRPTFEQSLAENLHLRDARFGAVVLLVAAVGARFSSDSRVYVPGTKQLSSVGGVWFRQVRIELQSLYAIPNLYDLQTYCLYAMYSQSSGGPQSGWAVIGVGIRLSQAAGAHRKRVYGKTLTAGDELWKRAFWVLVALDRLSSSSLGRPCAVQVEDFDLEFTVECDDEYWTATATNPAFTQPPGKPSKVSFFVSYLKLGDILASVLRTIYSIGKPKFPSAFVGGGWDQKVVVEIDSALSKWYESVPDHLRWDPRCENPEFLQQSTVLYAHYYNLQISVHRPFVATSPSQKPSALSFPSLAICMSAARSCSDLAKLSGERLGPIAHHLVMPSFTAGVILLLNIWGGKWAGMGINPTKGMEDVHRCMSVLSMAEKSWQPAGRLWDIMYNLACVGDLPLPDRNTDHSDERQSDSGGPPGVEIGAYPSPPATEVPEIVDGPHCTRNPVMRPSTLQRRRIPSTSDYQESTDLLDLGDSLHHTTIEELATKSGRPTADFREQPVVPDQGHDPMYQGTRGITTMPAGGVPVTHDTVGAPFAIDPLLYNDMMFSIGYPGAITSGIGPQGFRGFLSDGSGDTTLGQGRPVAEPQIRQQFNTPFQLHGGGSGVIPNTEGLTMWTNAPRGFEWDDWGAYAHSFNNMARQR